MKVPSLQFLLIILIVGGCSSGRDATRTSSEPYDTLTVGSLNVANLSRRVERDDVSRLARLISREGVHIVAVSGITRYPHVTTRTDLVDELTARTEMYSAFGESAMLSGRQTGNAVFSIYPIRSRNSTPYEGLRSATFASAFEAVIDCGLRDIVVVSTHLPDNAAKVDIAVCVNTLASLRAQYAPYAMIVAGNLFASPNPTGEFLIARAEGKETPFWFSNDGSLNLISQKTVKTSLGTMTVARFEVFRPPLP